MSLDQSEALTVGSRELPEIHLCDFLCEKVTKKARNDGILAIAPYRLMR